MSGETRPNTEANRRKRLIGKFSELKNKATDKGVTVKNLRDVFLVQNKTDTNSNKLDKEGKNGNGSKLLNFLNSEIPWNLRTVSIGLTLIGIISAVYVYFVFEIQSYADLRAAVLFQDSKCAIENNFFMNEAGRPLVDCSMCQSLKEVPIEHNLSLEDFKNKYAYTGVPVLVKEATKDWSAMHAFDYTYFKKIYTGTKGALDSVENECQFFPYKTEFDTLAEVFNMTDDRANFKEGELPWYIGWSNCHKDVQKELRLHYQRPYFLPNDSESSALDWLFMGGSGLGAFVHLDYVQRPSWQAQISGKKTWTLVPSPECEATCREMNVTVHKGDIFVIDTNEWYHATYIHPGDISITIGSEYD